jgi:head-tail adaptor
MPIDAGALDRRIRIERDGPSTHDGYQNVPGAPAPLATVSASVKPGGGRERYANAENAATAPMIFTIRWSRALDPTAPGGISPDDYIRYPASDAGQLYDIKSAVEMGLREGIVIAAIAQVGR